MPGAAGHQEPGKSAGRILPAALPPELGVNAVLFILKKKMTHLPLPPVPDRLPELLAGPEHDPAVRRDNCRGAVQGYFFGCAVFDHKRSQPPQFNPVGPADTLRKGLKQETGAKGSLPVG
jgi:hypothetical protein